jgi:hypothetical protein
MMMETECNDAGKRKRMSGIVGKDEMLGRGVFRRSIALPTPNFRHLGL